MTASRHIRANSLVRIPTIEEIRGESLKVQYGRKIKRLFGLDLKSKFTIEKLPYSTRLVIASYFESFFMVASIVHDIHFSQETLSLLLRSIAYDKLIGLVECYPESLKLKLRMIESKIGQSGAFLVIETPIASSYPSFYSLLDRSLNGGLKFSQDSNPLWLLNKCLIDPQLRDAIDKALNRGLFQSSLLDKLQKRFVLEFRPVQQSRKRSNETLPQELLLPSSKRYIGMELFRSILNPTSQ